MNKRRNSSSLKSLFCLCLGLIASLLLFTACEQGNGGESTITKWADLSGKKVAVLEGTNTAALLLQEVPDVQCQTYADYESAMKAFEKGETLAVAGDTLVLSLATQEKTEWRLLEETLPQEPYVFAVAKDNLSLAGAIDDTVLSCKDTGVYSGMAERWLQNSNETLPDELPAFENNTPNGTLHLGVVELPPFAYRGDSEQVLGFDVELAQRVADVLGKELTVLFYHSTDDLLAALKAGEIEMAGGCLTITEEQSQEFSFSQPYWESSVSLLVK